MASVAEIRLRLFQPSTMERPSSVSWSPMPNFSEMVSMSLSHIIGTINNKEHYFHANHMAKRLQSMEMERDELLSILE